MIDTAQPAYTSLSNIYAERTRQLVVWCGAGLSRPAKLPGWKELREELQAELLAKAETFGNADRAKLLQRAQAIASIADPWIAFEQLREALGMTSYNAAIRNALGPAHSAAVPAAYSAVWKLRLSGFLTLNLDGFAARSFGETNVGAPINAMSGTELASRLHLLQSPAPFVANLHGILEDVSSWVFTRPDFEKLRKGPGYSAFINAILATRTVLFLGITADDVAAGGFLANLTESGMDAGDHFWFTHRNDLETDAWAEAAGLRVIRYTGDAHAEAITELSKLLAAHTPVEPTAPPIAEGSIYAQAASAIPPPAELAQESPEHIRRILAEQASRLLGTSAPTDNKIAEFEEFCKEYRRPIHNAWHVDVTPPDNVFNGYTVDRQVGNGLFGHVYEAHRNGARVAIKLLRQENFGSREMAGSFRRGVRSMRILEARNVPGIVHYVEAQEVPACVVMEFVDGPNLKEAVDSGNLDLSQKIRICLEVARVVRAGHMLPERVLHRDIRPPNIMLRGFYHGDEWDVVVLDFDLSWHRGALEQSVVAHGSFAPYMAPELLRKISNVSTRSSAVDAFGLGMTMYYLMTGEEPPLLPGDRVIWQQNLVRAIRKSAHMPWHSLPARIGRLIDGATRPEQRNRLDFAQLEAELIRLGPIAVDPSSVDSAELWAEELVARAFGVDGYSFDEQSGARAASETGSSLSVKANEVASKLEAELSWSSNGGLHWNNVTKYLPRVRDKALAELRQAGWTSIENKASGYELSLRVEAPLVKVKTNPDAFARALSSARAFVRFDGM